MTDTAPSGLPDADEIRLALADRLNTPDPDPVLDIIAALESNHRPLLSPGMAVFDLPRRFLMNRYEDPSGTTGVGAIAWGCAWPDGSVSIHWQTNPRMLGGLYPDMETVLHLHGAHTSVEWVDT